MPCRPGLTGICQWRCQSDNKSSTLVRDIGTGKGCVYGEWSRMLLGFPLNFAVNLNKLLNAILTVLSVFFFKSHLISGYSNRIKLVPLRIAFVTKCHKGWSHLKPSAWTESENTQTLLNVVANTDHVPRPGWYAGACCLSLSWLALASLTFFWGNRASGCGNEKCLRVQG